MRRTIGQTVTTLVATMLLCVSASFCVYGQPRANQTREGNRAGGQKNSRATVRSVIIPITPRLRGSRAQQELVSLGNLTVREDGDEQKILSRREMGNSPLSLAVLVQDGLDPSINTEMAAISDFIRRLPRGSRVFVGYIRGGSLEVRHKFTADLERAADALRIPLSFASAAPSNPYVEIVDALKRFEPLPAGRRAMLVISDGLDSSRSLDAVSITQSLDLQRAINDAQRRSVAVYGLYAPSVIAALRNDRFIVLNAQGALERLSDETGGRAFFQGTGAPVSFERSLRELAVSLNRQIALTYLSTHPRKGFHRIEVTSDREDVEIDYPRGYRR
jgi:VWFA-related protein